MEFLVASRDSIKFLKIDNPYIVISISEPRGKIVDIPRSENLIYILRLFFHDLDDHQKTKITDAKNYILFTPNEARNIITFVKEYRDRVGTIVCQCDGGVSRSAGVAAALAKCINGFDNDFFKRYVPNRRVYRMLLNVWYDG